MTTSISQRLAWLFIALVLAPAAALAGKSDEAKAREATAHVEKATKAHQEGRYEEARVELEAAYALAPRPDLLYALGQVHAKLGNCREAATYFQRFAAAQNDPQVAKVVDEAIAECKPAAPPPAAPPPSPAIASSRPNEPPPAPARPATTTPATTDHPHQPSPASQPPRPAKPSPQPFAGTRAPAPAVQPQRAAWYQDKLGDGLVLGGVAAAVVGLIEYGSARSDLDAAEDRTKTTTLADYDDLVDSAHGKRTISIVLAGAGGALIAGGIVRYMLHDRGAEVRGVGVAPARGGGVVTYQGRF